MTELERQKLESQNNPRVGEHAKLYSDPLPVLRSVCFDSSRFSAVDEQAKPYSDPLPVLKSVCFDSSRFSTVDEHTPRLKKCML